jgi:Lysophospholipase L1 and related esterases
VGDSISAGPGCYKKYLDANLRNGGISNYEFVGEYTDDCGGGIRHSAVSCSTSADYTKPTFTLPNCFAGKTFPGLAQLMSQHNPDMVLMQLGVNDVWGGNTPVENVLNNYQTLVQQMRSHNPQVVIVVAQIHKIITDNCNNQAGYDNAKRLVDAVPAWATGLSQPDSPIFVADLWTNSDPYDANDCVHPNETGAEKMGLNWYNALKDLLW